MTQPENLLKNLDTNPLLARLYQNLQRLVGLHRQLLETVRSEKQALLAADLKLIQDITCTKQGIIETIRHSESDRMKTVAELAIAWKTPVRELTLTQLAITIQGEDLRGGDLLRATTQTLVILIEHITGQNNENRILVEKSLEHVSAMKKNVLGEATPRTNTYNSQAQRATPATGARLLEREA